MDSFSHDPTNIDVNDMDRDREVWHVFVYVGRQGGGSLRPLAHPPLLVLFCFGPLFLRLAFFVSGQHRAFLK